MGAHLQRPVRAGEPPLVQHLPVAAGPGVRFHREHGCGRPAKDATHRDRDGASAANPRRKPRKPDQNPEPAAVTWTEPDRTEVRRTMRLYPEAAEKEKGALPYGCSASGAASASRAEAYRVRGRGCAERGTRSAECEAVSLVGAELPAAATPPALEGRSGEGMGLLGRTRAHPPQHHCAAVRRLRCAGACATAIKWWVAAGAGDRHERAL